MSSCDIIVKVTGRYFVPTLLEEIERIRREEGRREKQEEGRTEEEEEEEEGRHKTCGEGGEESKECRAGTPGYRGVELVLQSTPNFWNMWEHDGGIVRSEVVGFDKRLVSFLFEGQNEEEGLPMERIIKIRSRELSNVKYFNRMVIDKTRNAEGIWIHDL